MNREARVHCARLNLDTLLSVSCGEIQRTAHFPSWIQKKCMGTIFEPINTYIVTHHLPGFRKRSHLPSKAQRVRQSVQEHLCRRICRTETTQTLGFLEQQLTNSEAKKSGLNLALLMNMACFCSRRHVCSQKLDLILQEDQSKLRVGHSLEEELLNPKS